jgi:hypothetical protein
LTAGNARVSSGTRRLERDWETSEGSAHTGSALMDFEYPEDRLDVAAMRRREQLFAWRLGLTQA